MRTPAIQIRCEVIHFYRTTGNSSSYDMDSASVTILDTPATSSAVSYKLFAGVPHSSSYYCTVNYQYSEGNYAYSSTTISTMTLTEIGGMTSVLKSPKSKTQQTRTVRQLLEVMVFSTTPRTCAFRMYPNAAQSLAHGTVTVLNFTNTSFDSDNLLDLSNNKVVITATTAGLWYLDITLRMSNTVAYRQTTQILVNGSAIVQGEQGFYS